MKETDIFDRIMRLPGLRIFYPFYSRHKMFLLYLFFGGIAFFLNLCLFVFIDRFIARILKINVLANNVICWIVCVLFQFWTNRTWVFDVKSDSANDFFRQLASFFCGRIFTLIIEEIILAVFISWLGFNATLVKIASQIIVIVLNFFISKFFVFGEKNE